MSRRAGFSLIELMTVVVILGMIAAFSVPGIAKALAGWNLHTSRELVISEVKLLREKAIAEGRSRHIWFSPGTSLYWFQNPTTNVWTSYNLPSRVTFLSVNFSPPSTGTFDTYLLPNGQSAGSGTIVLVNTKGVKDTVLVNLSGFVGQP